MTTEDAISNANDLGALGALIVVILILAGLLWFAYRSLNSKVGQINKAVNNSPVGDPTLLERIKRIEMGFDKLDDWFDDFNRHGWPSLPDDIGNAAALTMTIRDIQQRIETLHSRDDEQREVLNEVLSEAKALRAELQDHVDWEMRAKYGVHGDEHGS